MAWSWAERLGFERLMASYARYQLHRLLAFTRTVVVMAYTQGFPFTSTRP